MNSDLINRHQRSMILSPMINELNLQFYREHHRKQTLTDFEFGEVTIEENYLGGYTQFTTEREV